MEYIGVDLEKDPNITTKQLMQDPLFKEQQARYNKDWLNNMSGVALFTAIITTAAYYLPQIINLLDK